MKKKDCWTVLHHPKPVSVANSMNHTSSKGDAVKHGNQRFAGGNCCRRIYAFASSFVVSKFRGLIFNRTLEVAAYIKSNNASSLFTLASFIFK